MGLRDIRFGISTGGAASRAEWQERARRVEALGYDILLTADHLVDDAFPPLLPLVSAADVTERIRLVHLRREQRLPASGAASPARPPRSAC